MDSKQNKKVVVCRMDSSTTVEKLSRELEYSVRQARLDNPELSGKDVKLMIENSQDGESWMFASWECRPDSAEHKDEISKENIISEIRQAIVDGKKDVTYDCDYHSEKSRIVTRAICEMYHTIPGYVVYGTPLFDEKEERQIGIRVNIKNV